MMPEETLPFVRALVGEFLEPCVDTAPLALDSLTIVLLMEALEDRLGLAMAAADLVNENFETIAALAAFVARKSR